VPFFYRFGANAGRRDFSRRTLIHAGSNTLVLGYTVSYAISNVLLTFLGPVIVFTV
jgi:hypothetical protein